MPHKPRSAKRRLASPAQMERLRALVPQPFPEPIAYGLWRRWMRESRNPDSDGETARAAWQHFQGERVETPMAAFIEAFRARKAYEGGDVIQ